MNNAGVQVISPLLEQSPEVVENELNVNFLAPVLLCRGFLPHLLERESAVHQHDLWLGAGTEAIRLRILCEQSRLAQLLKDAALAA